MWYDDFDELNLLKYGVFLEDIPLKWINLEKVY